ncbi:MAG: S-methyl-5-thioribose-1-phosphate isomerase [Coriobacteriaceae bacterium]|nr:S-methyl-5-thioribose-1-phosphate isomerase [Coriobacteriaceae bacterium]
MELHLENLPKTVEIGRDADGVYFEYVDQRALPGELRMERTRDWRQVVDAVKVLAVRGAPAIGLAGAAALALWAAYAESLEGMRDAAEVIATARPTAVNLRWAVDRALAEVGDMPDGAGIAAAADALFSLVEAMQVEDEARNRRIGEHGAGLIAPGSRILTHCNAGSLATYYYGTALGVVYAAAEQGKVERVYADETRPVGQGARLTSWELARAGVPVTLICDNMAASLMAKGEVDAVIVGADRIARNGDVANKIGTYGLAVIAREHGVPFYVAAPSSTVDPRLEDGRGIVIEQRAASEVLAEPIEGVEVWNPAFDVTPARFITRIITEDGAFEPSALFG